MHLSQFVQRHPGCDVGQPDLLGPLSRVVCGALGCVAAVGWGLTKLVGGTPDSLATFVLLGLATACAAVALRALPRLAAVAALHRQGCSAYAIADDELILVDPMGRAVVVSLDRVTELAMSGDEPRIKTDSDDDGVVYATMFALFDSERLRPCPQRFFRTLAGRLREHRPHTRISRSTVACGLLYETD